MKTMRRTEINAHPAVAPALEAWRRAREDRDRVEFDGRYGDEARSKARKAANDAERAYDAAVNALLGKV